MIPALLRTMAYSNPSGKQNTFAGQVVPDLVALEWKQDKIPLSYVNAYEVPVPTWGSNPRVVENSVKRLAEYMDCMDQAYSLPILGRGWFSPRFSEIQPASCKRFANYNDLLEECVSMVRGNRA